MKTRIRSLDGLRFLAALGVLWIHTWTAFGNPRFYIGSIDITSFLAIGGNGVDLFFVISGFCMYYFYANKTDFSYHDYARFIKKRWFRLSPAFYAATVAYLIIINNYGAIFGKLFTSVFYLNSLIPNYNITAHFWTLGVEWQFYLLVPFILIYQHKIGFRNIFSTMFCTLFLAAVISVFIFKNNPDWVTNQIVFRGVEFGGGVIVAKLMLSDLPHLKYRTLWLITSLVIIFAGRVLLSKPVLGLLPYHYNLLKLVGFTIMGCGFSALLYLTLTSDGWLGKILGNTFFKDLGKISYSFYLWHVAIIPVAISAFKTLLPGTNGLAAPVITTVIATALLYPVSLLSYNLLEKPFFKQGNLTTA